MRKPITKYGEKLFYWGVQHGFTLGCLLKEREQALGVKLSRQERACILRIMKIQGYPDKNGCLVNVPKSATEYLARIRKGFNEG